MGLKILYLFACLKILQSSKILDVPSPVSVSQEDISLILVSQFDKKIYSYELKQEFKEPLSLVYGVLLHPTVSGRRQDLVEILVSLGADLNVCNRHGVTPLYTAIETEQVALTDFLITEGADPNFSVSGFSLLHIATFRNDIGIAKKLIELGASPDPQDESGRTPLYYAIQFNRSTIAKNLLKTGSDINIPQRNGMTFLHTAVIDNSLKTAKKLIKYGIKLDLMDSHSRTPLYLAIVENNSDFTELLIENGANVNYADLNGTTLLHRAAMKGNINAIDKILQFGGNISTLDKFDNTPLHMALKHNEIETIEYLVENYVNLSKNNFPKKNHPLSYAIQYSTKNSIETLLKLGSPIKVRNKNGFNPLVQSIFLNRTDITPLFMENNLQICFYVNENVDKHKNKPLHIAVLKEEINIVQKLLEHGANPNMTNKKGATPLKLAVERNNVDIIRILLVKNADLSYTNLETGDTLLHIAVVKKAYNATQELLHRGLKVDVINNNGLTPLLLAIQLNDTLMVRLLAANRNDINMTLANGLSPILTSISHSNLPMIVTLISLGAELESTNGNSSMERAIEMNKGEVIKMLVSKGMSIFSKKKSLLHLAADKDSFESIKVLLRMGIPVDDLENGLTPLWIATSKNNINSMKVLLQNGADMNFLTDHPFLSGKNISETKSWSLLHESVYLNLPNATKLLLDYGMNVDIHDYRDWTPLHYAAVSDNIALAKLLLEWGADVEAKSRNGITPMDLVGYSGEAWKASMVDILEQAKLNKDSLQSSPEVTAEEMAGQHPPYFVV